jgi:hypothetical protein
MVGFTKLADVTPTVPEHKSDDEIRLGFRLDQLGIVVDMEEDEKRHRYW